MPRLKEDFSWYEDPSKYDPSKHKTYTGLDLGSNILDYQKQISSDPDYTRRFKWVDKSKQGITESTIDKTGGYSRYDPRTGTFKKPSTTSSATAQSGYSRYDPRSNKWYTNEGMKTAEEIKQSTKPSFDWNEFLGGIGGKPIVGTGSGSGSGSVGGGYKAPSVDFEGLKGEAKSMAEARTELQRKALEGQLTNLDILTAQALGQAEQGAVGMGLGLEESMGKYGISGGLAMAQQSNLQAQIASQLGDIYGQKALAQTEIEGQIGKLPAEEELMIMDIYNQLLGTKGQELGLQDIQMGMEQKQMSMQQMKQQMAAQQQAQAQAGYDQQILAKLNQQFPNDPYEVSRLYQEYLARTGRGGFGAFPG